MEVRDRFLGAIPVDVEGAAVFILPLDRMEKIGWQTYPQQMPKKGRIGLDKLCGVWYI